MKRYVFLSLILVTSLLHAAQITLEWNGPTTNRDGTPLTDLQNYRIRWGPNIANLPFSITFATTPATGGGIQSKTINDPNLVAGSSYVFVVTAIDLSGNESDFSVATSTILPSVIIPSSPTIPGSLTFLPFKSVFNPLKEYTTAVFLLDGDGFGSSLAIHNRLGTKVRDLVISGNQSPWNGKNSSGQIVASDIYFMVLRQNKKIMKKEIVLMR